jgi:TRAP-type C4-dicarboxylate transport system permease small subunit
MTSFLRGFGRLLDLIGRVEQTFGVMLIATIVLTITIQVVTRYVFNWPLVWVEELATYCFIWGAFIGAALGHKHQRHIRIDTFVPRLSARGQTLFRIFGNTLTIGLCATLAVTAVTVMGVEGRSRSIALPIDIPRKWFYSVPLFVCACSIALTSFWFVLRDARELIVAGVERVRLVTEPAP